MTRVPVTCRAASPLLPVGRPLKVLTWNVQFLAGKGYVFWYDLPDNRGPHSRPSRAAIARTAAAVAAVIRAERPDLVLLQEVDQGAARTNHEDQLARLLALLPAEYACTTSTFYWKAPYVPHPRVRGAAGLTLCTLARYTIRVAGRWPLAVPPANRLTQQLSPRRVILETRLPLAGGGELVVLNTHLDAFAQGTATMARQVAQVGHRLRQLTAAGRPWVLGGDFNLLPPDAAAYDRLPASHQAYYNRPTELAPLLAVYPAVPSPTEAAGPQAPAWFTHFPNDPAIPAPDRTIDYLFFAPAVRVGAHYVRQHDTLTISDHLPVVSIFTVDPAAASAGESF